MKKIFRNIWNWIWNVMFYIHRFFVMISRFFYKIKRKIHDMIIRRFKPAENLGSRHWWFRRRCEAIVLARKIYDVEHANWKIQKQWRQEKKDYWDLLDGIWMHRSDDCMSWILWRTYDDQAREFCKIIPAFYLDEDCVRRLLYNQPWICI